MLEEVFAAEVADERRRLCLEGWLRILRQLAVDSGPSAGGEPREGLALELDELLGRVFHRDRFEPLAARLLVLQSNPTAPEFRRGDPALACVAAAQDEARRWLEAGAAGAPPPEEEARQRPRDRSRG